MARDSMLDGCEVCIGIVDFTKKKRMSHTDTLSHNLTAKCGIKSNNNESVP